MLKQNVWRLQFLVLLANFEKIKKIKLNKHWKLGETAFVKKKLQKLLLIRFQNLIKNTLFNVI